MTGDVNDVMPGSDGLGFLVILKKKQLVEIWNWTSELRSEPRRDQLGLGGPLRIVGSDGTVSIVKIVSLSPRVENLKVKKVIKVSYLNKESRQYFGIPMHVNVLYILYMYIYFS